MNNARSHRRHERLPRTAIMIAAFTVVFFCLPFIGLLWRTLSKSPKKADRPSAFF